MNILSTIADTFANLTNYPTVIYKIMVNGIDISNHLNTRLMNMTIQDHRGFVADSIDITLDDADGALEIPSVGAEMKVWLGWSDTGLIYKGSYLVTGGSHSGAPDQLRISAESTDLAETFRQKRERSFHNQPIQSIFEKIAFDYALSVKINDQLANIVINHIDQNESDANLITRIADENDAIATIKNNTLILLPIGLSQTTSGLDLPSVELVRTDGDSHTFSFGRSNNKIDGVKAYYHDKEKGEKKFVVVGCNDNNPKEIRFIHRDKKTAELAAQAEFNRCKRSEQTFTYSLAKGQPLLLPDQEFTLVCLKPQIDEIIWLGKTVTHDISESSGYTCRIELELKLPNADDVSVLFEDKTKDESQEKVGSRKPKTYKEYTGVKTWYGRGSKSTVITIGDQTTPFVIMTTYQTKKTAEAAINREYARIKIANGE